MEKKDLCEGILRSRLVRGMIIPLGKGTGIPGNKRWWNGMTIPILLFDNNSHILIRVKKKITKKNPTSYYFYFFKKIKLKKKN
jgi:hypothetical protein